MRSRTHGAMASRHLAARRALLGFLLGAAGALASPMWELRPDMGAGPTTEFFLQVVSKGRTLEVFPFTSEGVEGAEEVLRETMGARWEGSRTEVLMESLGDPIFFTKLDYAVSTARVPTFVLSLHPNDSVDEIFEGEMLWRMRRNTRGEAVKVDLYAVEAGDTLGELADAWGVTVDEVRRAHGHRFSVWPHKSTMRFRGDAGVPVIRMGESHMRERSWTEGDIRYVLLHEAGHVGDPSTCSSHDDRYGPDGTHRLREVTTPAAAFSEGWGNYRGLHSHEEDFALNRMDEYGSMERMIQERRYPYPYLQFEVTDPATHQAGQKGRYEPIHCEDLNVHDLVSSELMVARLLWALRDLSMGPFATVRAFRESSDVSCRALPDFLEAYLEEFPEHREDLDWVIDYEWQEIADRAQRERLMAGAIPEVEGRTLARNERPRTKDYRAAEGYDPDTCWAGEEEEGGGAAADGGALGQ